jgi:hypothetical protein
MTSQLITPPDKIISDNSYLVINAVDSEIENLIIWLKTINDSYDIHFWHDRMSERDWAIELARKVRYVLANSNPVADLIRTELGSVPIIYWGSQYQYQTLVDYFISNK